MEESEKKRSLLRYCYDTSREFTVTIMAFILFITFVAQTFAVDGNSMQPTLENGERLIAEKLSYRFSSIDRGDIVVLNYPVDPSKNFVKRVVGLSGDIISVQRGEVYINGEPMKEEYIDPAYASMDSSSTIKVPQGYYFVMGDHRSVSSDSRHWGFVPKKYLQGRVCFRYWPLTRLSIL